MPVSGLVITLSPKPPDPPPDITPDTPDITPDITPDHAPESLAKSVISRDIGHESVVQLIRNHPHLEPGPRQNLRLPVVVDTPDRESDKDCWRWLNELPGVHQVDVAFIYFEDDDPVATSCFNATRDNNLIAGPTIGET